MSARFAGRVAVVTGGGSGIGRQCCRALAAEGAALVVADRDPESAERVAAELKAGGAEAVPVAVDVARSAEVAELARRAEAWKGAVHVVCSAAGIESVGTVEEADEEEWDRTLSVNLTGTFLVCRHLVPVLRRSGGGAVVTVASLFGLVGTRNMAAYCASKGGVVMLTRAMALDHAAEGIRFNAVCPGPVRTPMLGRIFTGLRRAGVGIGDSGLDRIPLGRTATPEEVASAVLYLASPEAGHVTGTVLSVDGGASAM